jgi:hypothetical protein
LEHEAREIEAKIRAADHRDSLELITRWAVRPDDLLQYLNQYKPHVVHFSGHGSSTEEIVLLDNQGEAKPVSKEALVSLFRTLRDNIRLVLLNACYSRSQAEAITSEIDCSIGMSGEISDYAAIAFATSFYRAIGFGRSVREAFDQGKTALLLEGIPEEKTPSLLTRSTITPEAIILINPSVGPSLEPEPQAAGLQDGYLIESPNVRWPAPMPFQPDLANRKEEWPAIVELLTGRSRERILLYEGASGLGKSVIVRQAAVYARKLGIPVVYLDFKGGGIDIESVLGHFDLELSHHLPNFARSGANKTHLLRKDLRELRQPVLIICDSYEDCVENKIVVDWLNLQFLTEVETALGLAVIIAGQKVPDFTKASWRDLARYLPLKPINEIEHWEPWIERRFPDFRSRGAHLPTVVMVAKGNPALISVSCEVISKS